MTTAQESAEAAAEAVRALNHATIHGGYEWPSEVDAVLASLSVMASRLPQAIGQAARWLAAADDAGDVGHDEGADPVAVVAEAVAVLEDASGVAHRLYGFLDEAHQLTAHLTGVVDDDVYEGSPAW